MVLARENYNLDERARRASVEGLAITQPGWTHACPAR